MAGMSGTKTPGMYMKMDVGANMRTRMGMGALMSRRSFGRGGGWPP